MAEQQPATAPLITVNDTAMSWLRTTMAGVSGWAIGKGYGDANLWAMISGVVLLIVPYVWGVFAHSPQAKLAAVEAMPEVCKIVVAPVQGTAAAEAVADATRPKVAAA